MVRVDTIKATRSLDNALMLITKGLTNMVKEFSTETAIEAINITPFGDDTNSLYRLASRLNYLPDVAGTAKGGWVLSLGTPSIALFPDRATSADAGDIKTKVRTAVQGYVLGQDIFITNNVPYMMQDGWTYRQAASLDSGYSSQAPDGIKEPTTEFVIKVLNKSLVQFYNKGKV